MRRVSAGSWDELHSRMLRSEGLGGTVILAFQVLIVAGLILS